MLDDAFNDPTGAVLRFAEAEGVGPAEVLRVERDDHVCGSYPYWIEFRLPTGDYEVTVTAPGKEKWYPPPDGVHYYRSRTPLWTSHTVLPTPSRGPVVITGGVSWADADRGVDDRQAWLNVFDAALRKVAAQAKRLANRGTTTS